MLRCAVRRRCFTAVVSERCYTRISRQEVDKLLELHQFLMNEKGLKNAQRRNTLSGLTRTVCEELSSSLSRTGLCTNVVTILCSILRVMRDIEMYDKDSFDLMASCLQNTSSELVMQRIVPHFINLCTKVRYYNPSLLDWICPYVVDNINWWNPRQLLSLVHCYGQFNHHYPPFTSAVEKYLIQDNLYLSSKVLAWIALWAGMIHLDMPKELAGLMLKDSYIEGMNDNF